MKTLIVSFVDIYRFLRSNHSVLMFPAHYNFTIYGDQAEFSMYKFPERAHTYKVNSGGWALYSEPHFQGKVMYQFGSEYWFYLLQHSVEMS